MKKLIAVLLIIAATLSLGGCNEKLSEWNVESEIGNGMYVVVPEEKVKGVEWYCTVDYATSSILTVNLIYPDVYGKPLETVCTANGKNVSCEVTSAEQEGADIVFYQLPIDISHFSFDEKITITQKFANEKVKITFKPSMVGNAFVLD